MVSGAVEDDDKRHWYEKHPFWASLLAPTVLIGVAWGAIEARNAARQEVIVQKIDNNHDNEMAELARVRTDAAKLEERIASVKGVVLDLAAREDDAPLLMRRLSSDQKVMAGAALYEKGQYVEAVSAFLSSGDAATSGVIEVAAMNLKLKANDPSGTADDRANARQALGRLPAEFTVRLEWDEHQNHGGDEEPKPESR